MSSCSTIPTADTNFCRYYCHLKPAEYKKGNLFSCRQTYFFFLSVHDCGYSGILSDGIPDSIHFCLSDFVCRYLWIIFSAKYTGFQHRFGTAPVCCPVCASRTPGQRTAFASDRNFLWDSDESLHARKFSKNPTGTIRAGTDIPEYIPPDRPWYCDGQTTCLHLFWSVRSGFDFKETGKRGARKSGKYITVRWTVFCEICRNAKKPEAGSWKTLSEYPTFTWCSDSGACHLSFYRRCQYKISWIQ